jgi:hypothetical protein
VITELGPIFHAKLRLLLPLENIEVVGVLRVNQSELLFTFCFLLIRGSTPMNNQN